MLNILFERLRQKHRTAPYPAAAPSLPERFRGRPFIHADRCLRMAGGSCGACAAVCPSQALALQDSSPALDMGCCTFCGQCSHACPTSAVVFSRDWRLASTSREALVIRPAVLEGAPEIPAGRHAPILPPDKDPYLALPPLPVTPPAELQKLFRRSFRLRQVSAAGCNACEADLNVLTTLVFDLARFGIDFVASPRHADAVALTGPVPRNMRDALNKSARAMPDPKVLIANGACAISGGLFRSLPGRASRPRAEGVLPHREADLFIPGCPPHPYTALDGMLRFLGRIT